MMLNYDTYNNMHTEATDKERKIILIYQDTMPLLVVRSLETYFLARKPLACDWKAMITTVIFRSLSSSSWANTPVLKKILLWPIRYRLGSRSRCLICRHTEKEKEKERSLRARASEKVSRKIQSDSHGLCNNTTHMGELRKIKI